MVIHQCVTKFWSYTGVTMVINGWYGLTMSMGPIVNRSLRQQKNEGRKEILGEGEVRQKRDDIDLHVQCKMLATLFMYGRLKVYFLVI